MWGNVGNERMYSALRKEERIEWYRSPIINKRARGRVKPTSPLQRRHFTRVRLGNTIDLLHCYMSVINLFFLPNPLRHTSAHLHFVFGRLWQLRRVCQSIVLQTTSPSIIKKRSKLLDLF